MPVRGKAAALTAATVGATELIGLLVAFVGRTVALVLVDSGGVVGGVLGG